MFLIKIYHKCLDSNFKVLGLIKPLTFLYYMEMFDHYKHQNLCFHNKFPMILNVIRLNQCPGCTLCQIHNIYTIKYDLSNCSPFFIK